MEHRPTNREIRATLWPQRLVQVRRSLNRSSRIIVLLGLGSLMSMALWVGLEKSLPGLSLHRLDFFAWRHPVVISSLLTAIMIVYAMRQVSRTREKLNPLGYLLLEQAEPYRYVETWRSVEPLTKRPVLLKIIAADKVPCDHCAWLAASQGWIRRAEKARRLSSPHIAQLIDTGYAQQQRFYAAMEMPRGIRLDGFIHRFGACPLDRSLFLLAQLVHAIQDAHELDLSPLEITSRNIWIGQRTCNDDWLTLLPLGYDLDEYRAGEAVASDYRNFARIAMLLLTGSSPDETEAINTEEAERLLAMQQVPFLIRDQLRRCLTAGVNRELPPLREIMRGLWEAQPGQPWTNDRARAWWHENQPRKELG